MKVQVSLDERLVERIDSYADANYTSRSGFISFVTSLYLNQVDVINESNKQSEGSYQV